jgi:hypothetical protein
MPDWMDDALTPRLASRIGSPFCAPAATWGNTPCSVMIFCGMITTPAVLEIPPRVTTSAVISAAVSVILYSPFSQVASTSAGAFVGATATLPSRTMRSV